MSELPGVPLDSGFTNWRPAADLALPREAQARIQAVIDDVARCRLLALADAQTSVVGAAS